MWIENAFLSWKFFEQRKNGVEVSYFFKKREVKCGNEQNEPLKIYLQFIWKRSYRLFSNLAYKLSN